MPETAWAYPNPPHGKDAKPQAEGFQGATAPLAASSNGKRLLSSSCGVCMELIVSINPSRTAAITACLIILRAQRRFHLKEGPVIRNIQLIQRQVVD